MIENVAILAGGLATRLRPITEKIPKALVVVSGRPFIAWQLELLARQGVRRVVLCLGYLGEQVEALVGDGRQFGLEVAYSYDGPQLLGTGGALVRAAPWLDDQFWVLYGDSYLNFDYRAVAAEFEAQREGHPDLLGLMTVFRNQERWDSSNVWFEAKTGHLLEYNKFQKRPEMEYIDYGAAILQKAALTYLPQNQPSDLATLYNSLVAQTRMVGYEVQQRFYEVGSHSGLAEMEQFLSNLKSKI